VNQRELLQYVLQTVERLEVPYMLVGSFASGAYGEPRLTHDIDVVIQLRRGDVDEICQAFPPPEYYVSREAALAAWAKGGQFNVIHGRSGNKIDFLIAGDDAYGQCEFERRQRTRILPGCDGYAARPEDVIIGKMRYYAEGGSEKHLRDITGILKVSADKVDQAYVAQWARVLGVAEIWSSILRRLGQGPADG